jgi:hypothetical protein
MAMLNIESPRHIEDIMANSKDPKVQDLYRCIDFAKNKTVETTSAGARNLLFGIASIGLGTGVYLQALALQQVNPESDNFGIRVIMSGISFFSGAILSGTSAANFHEAAFYRGEVNAYRHVLAELHLTPGQVGIN